MRKLAIRRCTLYALFMIFPGIFKVIFAKPFTAIIRLTLPVPLKHAYCSNFSNLHCLLFAITQHNLATAHSQAILHK